LIPATTVATYQTTVSVPTTQPTTPAPTSTPQTPQPSQNQSNNNKNYTSTPKKQHTLKPKENSKDKLVRTVTKSVLTPIALKSNKKPLQLLTDRFQVDLLSLTTTHSYGTLLYQNLSKVFDTAVVNSDMIAFNGNLNQDFIFSLLGDFNNGFQHTHCFDTDYDELFDTIGL
jgi:hypothetical protein